MPPKLHSTHIGIEFIEEDGNLIPAIVYRKGKQWLRPLEAEFFLTLYTKDKSFPLNIQSAKRTQSGISFFGSLKTDSAHFQLTGSFEINKGSVETIKTKVKIKLQKGHSQRIHLESCWSVQDNGIPRWLVPGIFYKHNRPPSCVTLYPAYNPEDGDHKLFVSDHWFFRSDRITHPSVFCWTKNFTNSLIWNSINVKRVGKPGPYSIDDTGVGFMGNKGGTYLYLTFPYSERPVTHSGTGRDKNYHDFKGIEPETKFIVLNKGDEIYLDYSIYAGDYDLHAYNPIIRDIYSRCRDNNPPNPWMPKQQSSELTAYSLINWHYDEKEHVLYETCAFDSYFGKGKKQVDRPHMHVSWVSGIPYAYALLKYSYYKNDIPQDWSNASKEDIASRIIYSQPYGSPARSIIDKITSEGKSLSGFFYPEWTKEKGWGTGWNPNPNWIQSRTIAECVFFLLKSIGLLYRNEHPYDDFWIEVAKKNLDLISKRQNKEGNFGSYYDLNAGKVIEWEGAGGILWIPALLLASKLFKEEIYRASALSAAQYYKKFVEDDYIYGAPEDVHLCPTSEDAYNAVMAYVAVYEETGDKKWLEIAKRAADLMETHRFAYNVTFPKHTILEKYDYRTIGGDIASPSNQHIHNYGLVCTPEILKLWEWTEDDYYLERMKDHLFCFQQFIARRDGDFGAMKGMVTERWFHTDWDHAKGDMLQLAHSWCAGLILYANLCIHEFGDILVNLDSGKVHPVRVSRGNNQNINSTGDSNGVHVLESININNLKKTKNQITFTLENPYDMDLNLTVGVYHQKGKPVIRQDKETKQGIESEKVSLALNPKNKTKFDIQIPAKGKTQLTIG